MGVGLGNLGPSMLTSWLMGEATGTYAYFNNANTYIGVGNSSTAYASSQTDLIGTNYRQAISATYPTRSGAVSTWVALFATGNANFAWNEVGIFNAASTGQMLTRDVPGSTLITKTSSFSVQLTVTLTLS